MFQLKNLDALEILKLGIVGLGFFLTLFCFWLLQRELKKQNVRMQALKAIKQFMLFSLIIAFLALIWEVVDKPQFLEILFANKQIKIATVKSIDQSSIDTKNYDIVSNYSFAFKKFNRNEWSIIESFDGLDGIIKSNFEKSDTSSGTKLIYSTVKGSPIAEMIEHQKMFIVSNKNSSFKVHLTDSTTNPNIEFQLSQVKNEAIASGGYNLKNSNDSIQLEKDLQEYKIENFLQVRNILYANRFSVTVLDKSFLPTFLKTMTIADLFKYISTSIPSINQIVSSDSTILLQGVTSNYNNVIIDDKLSTFQCDKLYLLVSNNSFFYIVEITYSPQANMPTKIYEDLISHLQSFTLLN